MEVGKYEKNEGLVFILLLVLVLLLVMDYN
jgi:hypothetical protein